MGLQSLPSFLLLSFLLLFLLTFLCVPMFRSTDREGEGVGGVSPSLLFLFMVAPFALLLQQSRISKPPFYYVHLKKVILVITLANPPFTPGIKSPLY